MNLIKGETMEDKVELHLDPLLGGATERDDARGKTTFIHWMQHALMKSGNQDIRYPSKKQQMVYQTSWAAFKPYRSKDL